MHALIGGMSKGVASLMTVCLMDKTIKESNEVFFIAAAKVRHASKKASKHSFECSSMKNAFEVQLREMLL